MKQERILMPRPELQSGDWVRHGTGAGNISLFLTLDHLDKTRILIWDSLNQRAKSDTLDSVDVVWRSQASIAIWSSDGRDYNVPGQPR